MAGLDTLVTRGFTHGAASLALAYTPQPPHPRQRSCLCPRRPHPPMYHSRFALSISRTTLNHAVTAALTNVMRWWWHHCSFAEEAIAPAMTIFSKPTDVPVRQVRIFYTAPVLLAPPLMRVVSSHPFEWYCRDKCAIIKSIQV